MSSHDDIDRNPQTAQIGDESPDVSVHARDHPRIHGHALREIGPPIGRQ